jgi:Calcineurin-like phosphoesterase
MTKTSALIQPLAQGPLDIIGDIHGEIDALSALLERLGYRTDGTHPENRHLVFVGDLCDRGPDSPAVIFKVRDLVESGRAQCVLGNHELNILRSEKKEGSHWFAAKEEITYQAEVAKFGPSARLKPHHEAEILEFFASLPVALERSDLRVVHAAWDTASIAAIRGTSGSVLDIYREFDHKIDASPQGQILKPLAHQQKKQYEHLLKDHNLSAFTPFLTDHAEWDQFYQCANPIRVLTSGLEKVTKTPFFTGGQWRFVERVNWWASYTDAPAVVFGHYWRVWNAAARANVSKAGPQLFDDQNPEGWHKNDLGREVAFCVDYSVGARHRERKNGVSLPFHGRLAALRWPEGTPLFDHP